jgi:hypothetical protein
MLRYLAKSSGKTCCFIAVATPDKQRDGPSGTQCHRRGDQRAV